VSSSNRVQWTAYAVQGFVFLVLCMFAIASSARELYRYRNAEGNIVVDYQVPVNYVGSGYEVLNDEGIVIKVVPRALTEEEQKVQDAQDRLAAEARAEEERLKAWDESLMLRYSTVADIEAARDRALRDLQIRLSILKGNRRSLKQKVENYQAQAADLERRGMEVDVARLRTIEDLQTEIGTTERAIVDREHDIEDLADTFQKDIDRFEMLLEVVDLRRQLGEEREKSKRGGERTNPEACPATGWATASRKNPCIRISHCSCQSAVGGRRKPLRTYCDMRPSAAAINRLAAAGRGIVGRKPSRTSASRITCLSWVSNRSNSCATRWCRRSVSPARASPVRMRVIPGFLSVNASNSMSIFSQRAAAVCSSLMMMAIRLNRVSSINSMRPSNIFDLLGKWRYRAASETPTWRASPAVVILLPGLASSIWARASRICWRR